MDLSQLFSLRTQAPLRGGEAGITISQAAQEIVDAATAGSGAGQPDANGTPTAGTIVPGQIVQMNASGNLELATQCDLSAAFPKMYLVVHTGDKDFSGAFVGKLNAVHGGVRFDTLSYDAGSYSPGDPLVISSGTAGNVMKKGAVGDHIQMIGFVGPRGVDAATSVLDVIMPQGNVQGS